MVLREQYSVPASIQSIISYFILMPPLTTILLKYFISIPFVTPLTIKIKRLAIKYKPFNFIFVCKGLHRHQKIFIIFNYLFITELLSFISVFTSTLFTSKLLFKVLNSTSADLKPSS